MTLPPLDEDTYADYMGTAPMSPSAPVAVRVLADQPLPVEQRATRQWTCGQVQVRTGTIGQLATGNPSRVRLVVKNIGTTTIMVAPDNPTCSPTSAFPLLPGEREEWTTRHPVYAMSVDADSVVAILAEHLDG
ncbi:hypothetical protein [Streptomyces sp. NPDC051657]|uniref:hypothetical protein n=1 Tax=unclassified Streptomyces TaxID=2593676 RepID=UPI0034434858